MAEVYALPLRLRIALANLETNGYTHIPNVFTWDEAQAIRSAAKRAVAASPETVQWLPNGQPALVFWPRAIEPDLARFADDHRLRSIVHEVLGTEVRQINNQVYFREGGDGDQFAWHQDIMFRTPAEDFNDIANNYLQTVIVVDTMSHDNGAIEFLPASHKRGDLNLIAHETDPALRRFVRGDSYGVKIEANPGDLLLWHPLVVHGSEPNNSGHPRVTYMNGFAAEHAVLNKGKYPQWPGNPKKS